jgi:Raf kinase inhibitor-like YbhB/YbcL family protein
MKFAVIFLILIIGAGSYFYFSHQPLTQNSSTQKRVSVTMKESKGKKMTISSTAFADHTTIPTEFTCDGKSVNPPLTFGNVPENARSLVLIMDDPDVPKNIKQDGVFDHWVIYNIDPGVTEIKEDSTPAGVQGLNGAGKIGYYPACPPDREHRYFFDLYALDSQLKFQDPSKVTKQMVLDAMQGHIVEQAELVGLYNRPQNVNK